MSESPQESLLVECPRCHSRFRAREDQLAVARGRVRCGVCLALFDSGNDRSAQTPAVDPPGVNRADDAPQATPPQDGKQRRWGWIALLWAGMTVAALALVVQVFAYRFDRWSSEPQLRFIYEFACGAIGCELPAPTTSQSIQFFSDKTFIASLIWRGENCSFLLFHA